MIPIKQLLDKIKWDKAENPYDYTLFYYDRVANNLKKIKYIDIEKIEDNFLIITLEGKETNLPLHRIRKVMKKDEVIWERKSE